MNKLIDLVHHYFLNRSYFNQVTNKDEKLLATNIKSLMKKSFEAGVAYKESFIGEYEGDDGSIQDCVSSVGTGDDFDTWFKKKYG